MHHRDGPKPIAEHPPVLIKVEAADVRCLWVLERKRGGASWGCRLTALESWWGEGWPGAADQVGTWIGPVPKVCL